MLFKMKTYDITELTAELKSSDNVRYRNKIYVVCTFLVGVTLGNTDNNTGNSNVGCRQ